VIETPFHYFYTNEKGADRNLLLKSALSGYFLLKVSVEKSLESLVVTSFVAAFFAECNEKHLCCKLF
jgi:hypothetical protein